MGLLNIFKKVTGIATVQNKINEGIRLAKITVFVRLIREYDIGKSANGKVIAARVADSLFFANQEDFHILNENPIVKKETEKSLRETSKWDKEIERENAIKLKVLEYREKVLKDNNTREMVVELLKMYMAYYMYDEIPDQEKPINKGVDVREWQRVLISEFLKKYDPSALQLARYGADTEKAFSLAHKYGEIYGGNRKVK